MWPLGEQEEKVETGCCRHFPSPTQSAHSLTAVSAVQDGSLSPAQPGPPLVSGVLSQVCHETARVTQHLCFGGQLLPQGSRVLPSCAQKSLPAGLLLCHSWDAP